MLLPFPRYVYGKMVVKGEVRDDQDRLVDDQNSREMLVIELLDDFEVVDKKVGQHQLSIIGRLVPSGYLNSITIQVLFGPLVCVGPGLPLSDYVSCLTQQKSALFLYVSICLYP